MIMVSINFSELLDSFAFASAGFRGESKVYISIDTGAIFWVSEYIDRQADIPKNIETSDRYIAMPHKTELDLGQSLVMSFAAEKLSDDNYTTVAGFFRRKGAYSRFKDFLDERGLLEEWYAFEEEASELALREWCEENGIQPVDG
jgi:hypothetical protein